MAKQKTSDSIETTGGSITESWWQDRAVDRGWHAIEGPQEFNLDVYGGGGFTYRGKPIADLDRVTDQIWTGRTITPTDNVITYGFLNVNHAVGINNNPHLGEGRGYSAFSAAQQAAAIESVQFWDELIPQSFVNIGDVSVSQWAQHEATILFANTTTGPAQAWAYYPGYGAQYTRLSSDVWIASPEVNFTNEWFSPGGYGNTTLIHELGHTLGLSHPGAYNGAGATNYLNQAEYAQDSMQYTIMSYWSGSETGALTVNWAQFLNNYAQTPMLHDIYAIQQAYGVDTTTRTDDTIYGFNTNTDRWVFDFSVNPYPYLAIWDAGGNDTIDLSGFTAGNFLDLHAGSFSSVGQGLPDAASVNAARGADGFTTNITQAQIDATGASYMIAAEARIFGDSGEHGVYATAHDNLAIAYGVTIENAVGGQARDVIWGNEVANILDGQGGNDTIRGFEGDDIIIGGIGNDVLTGDSGADTFVFSDFELGDIITDLEADDFIDLSGLGDGSVDLSYIGDTAFSGTAGEVNYQGGVLSVDYDGDASADFSVTLTGTPDLDAAQLVLATS